MKSVIIKISWQNDFLDYDVFKRAQLLRGAISHLFIENDLFHQHDNLGKSIYRYPKIQYRWNLDKKTNKGSIGEGIIIGFNEAIEPLMQLFTSNIEIKLGDTKMYSSDIACEIRNINLGISDELHEYYFRTPWIPLKQEKYENFKELSRNNQKKELNRIIRGNILTAARGLDIKFENTVYTYFNEKKRLQCRYKDIKLQGFTGKFITNVKLPEDFALGGKVSHGYGWMKTI